MCIYEWLIVSANHAKGTRAVSTYGSTGRVLPELPYVLAALVPFAWFALTINHSYMHIFFVCKTLAGPAFAGMVWLTGIWNKKGDLRGN